MTKSKGFTLVEIMIVVAIIAILAAIAIPQLITSRKDARAKRCINNMKLYEHSKEQAALALGAASGTELNYSDVEDFIRDGHIEDVIHIQCPLRGDVLIRLTPRHTTACGSSARVEFPTQARSGRQPWATAVG